MSTIYFDESGQTGTQLRDAQQPYFCVGSTDLSDDASRDILLASFPRQTVGEIKAQNVLSRASGRRQFLKFCEALASQPDRFCFVKINKRFGVLSKMVDNLVEPVVRAGGYDFYKNDYGRRFANSAYFAFDQILARDVGDRLLDLYNDFARDPSQRALDALQTSLLEALQSAPHGTELFLGLMCEGAEHFEQLHDLEDFKGSNEIHVTAILRSMAHWQKHSQAPFKVIHDESIHFFGNSRGWRYMTDPAMSAQVLNVGDKTLTLPINVVETVPAKSHESASLQLCDLMAGFLTRFASPNLDAEQRRFLQDAIAAGIGTVSIFPIEADYDFVNGYPEKADGPDVVDQIAMAIANTQARRD
ncbi:DUF3800 domain-containing protein [Rhizobium leguminosarum]|uniref:DUF3800 domain-containing protein n=1 Tax=Rhizobium leguminosarum TaxID=384 RepID=UPI001C966712|nr:DUF3800 domain-containing protein [Rhizobium leguminosarum]MBY5378925.1 DUF3800 domain-containing protein [Rhizobium leguminosarum]